jgi:type II secretory pathway component PulF
VNETFRYRAATVSGDLVEGVVHAGSPRDAADELRRQTLVPVSIESTTRQAAPVRGPSSRAGRRESVAAAIRTVATLVSAGIALERALDFAARHASHPDVAAAFAVIRADVQRGSMLSDAVRKQPLLGSFAAAVCRAGEESGTLDASLGRLADWFDREQELRSQVRSALTYPALMGIVAGVGVVILLTFVVPRFVAILGDIGGELPMSTRLLVGASGLVTGWWWIWIPAFVALVFGTRWWLEQPGNRKRWHANRLRLPAIGALERNATTAQFANALGVLLQGGTPALAAVRVAREGVTNESMAGELDLAGEKIARGERISTSMAGALPPLAVELLSAGEESGRLAEMCARVAAVHEEAAGRSLRTLVRLIEPVLILVFGAVVGFIALAMLQAIYGVNIGVL